ncbi:GntR family transcriptional regulator, partial [Aliidongia dinghuensis]|uniref:GntR family transcriptional regulator n=1 Tax=Aliidongia dinghuensis TaxID=1867774 RepID=UPI00166696CF
MTVSAEQDQAGEQGQASEQGQTSAGQPLYQRIRSEIEGNILSGRWPPGYRLPSEVELTETYGCSRMTINKVLSALANAGLIERRRKAGSFVSRPRVQSAVLQIPDMRAEIERRGEEYGYELLAKHRRLATADDCGRLGIAKRVPILALRCRHLTGGQPFALEDRLLNLGEVPDALDQDFATVPPNTWLVG